MSIQLSDHEWDALEVAFGNADRRARVKVVTSRGQSHLVVDDLEAYSIERDQTTGRLVVGDDGFQWIVFPRDAAATP